MKKITCFIIGVWLTGVSGCSKDSQVNQALVTFMLGDVKKNSLAINIGDSFQVNDTMTVGTNSLCDLKIGDSMVRIKENSKFKLTAFAKTAIAENVEVELAVGKTLCKPKKLLRTESFVVKTPTAVAAVRGTSFVVESDPQQKTRVTVLDGKVNIAMRLKQFELFTDKILNVSRVLDERQMIEITFDEVKKAEIAVEKIVQDMNIEGKDALSSLNADQLIERSSKVIVLSPNEITSFSSEDIKVKKVNAEMNDIHSAIEKKIELEKQNDITEKSEDIQNTVNPAQPYPAKPGMNIGRGGRLLVTRTNIIHSINGKVVWEGAIVEMPVKKGGYTYVASGDYVFCTQPNGTVVWKRKLTNMGKIEFGDQNLLVITPGGKKSLHLKNGSDMM